MKKNRMISAVLAALLLAAPTASLPMDAAASYKMTVTIDTQKDQKAISPYIYGVNEYSNSKILDTVKVNNVRHGGNRFSAYNWENNYSNAGNDWKHMSDDFFGREKDGPGYAARSFSENMAKHEIPYKITTLQMAGYVSADMNGTVEESETAPSDRWKKVELVKGSEFSLEPDLTDDVVYMDEYVNYMVKTLGDAESKTGMQGYSLDNEPALWNDSHFRMHPDEVTNEELMSKSITLANAVKEIDPKAEVFGPAFWGMLPCIQAGEVNGFTDPQWQVVKNDYNWYMEYYLKQMKDAEAQYGKRLLDVFDVHYYSQGITNDDDILQAARSLYDKDYIENSWLQPSCGKYFPFLPNMQESIEKYYPGTKLAVSEYNLGNIGSEKTTGKSVYTAIAEAEALGAFALNDVYFATYWGTLPECPYVVSAINLYTNYDGKGAAFGDTLVSATTEDLSKAAAFASINGTDDSTVTLTLSNKDKTEAETAEITINGNTKDYKSAVVYAITQDSSDIKIIDIQNDLSGNKITVELPALSVAQIVISDKESTAEIVEEPEITTVEKEYKLDELELSANGYPMIPIGDKDHLKEIVINTTASSSQGSGYGGGGGGLCFNKVVPEGETAAVWASKSFSWGLGNNVDNVVPFDDTFTIVVDEKGVDVKGVTKDDYIEFQGEWWKYSEKDEAGADISVTYNSIKMVYEYEEGEQVPGEDPTQDTPTEPETQEGTAGDVAYGDVDVNGSVNIIDVITLNKSLMVGEKLSDQGKKNADVDNNQKVDEVDSLNILKSVVEIQTLPVK